MVTKVTSRFYLCFFFWFVVWLDPSSIYRKSPSYIIGFYKTSVLFFSWDLDTDTYWISRFGWFLLDTFNVLIWCLSRQYTLVDFV